MSHHDKVSTLNMCKDIPLRIKASIIMIYRFIALGYRLELICGNSQYCAPNFYPFKETGVPPKVMLIETSVFSTIFVNSSKLILPSRSVSASIMVLSTIYCHTLCRQPVSPKILIQTQSSATSLVHLPFLNPNRSGFCT